METTRLLAIPIRYFDYYYKHQTELEYIPSAIQAVKNLDYRAISYLDTYHISTQTSLFVRVELH
jgi:hypothetical protein